MEAVRTEWKAEDGTKIFGQFWKPEGELRGVVAVVHGLGEHSGRYGHVAEMLAGHGFGLFGFDHRGHGRSAGPRGHIPSYEALMSDVRIFLDRVGDVFGDIPVFLYGHSWGGNITANYLLRHQPSVQGVILSGPWLILPEAPPAIKVFLAKIMNMIYPAYPENNGIPASDLCYDEDVVKAYENDPLVHPKITARNFLESNAAAAYALEKAGQLSMPILLMHGKDDKITSPKGSEAFAKAAPADKVTLKLYEKMKHEIHNELKNSLVFADVLDYMNARLAP